jgi:hypothetical protein
MPLPPIMTPEELVIFLIKEIKMRQKEEKKSLTELESDSLSLPENVIDFAAYIKKISS